MAMEKEMLSVAGMMAVAARTAPKAKGEDFVEIKVISGAEVNRLADDMVRYGVEKGKANFDRDGENVRNSPAVLLLALREPLHLGLNCGACGFATCAEMNDQLQVGEEFSGPLCAWRLIDLGIALGSAVKTASILNADNRIMYRIGVSALRLKQVEGEIAVGVPISATGKSIYFDR